MDATTDLRQRTLSVDDIWTPDEPLPAGAKLKEIARRCGQLWEMPRLHKSVRISYNPRLVSTLGRASLNDCRVELNTRLLRDHPAELVPTLVHELAHAAAHIRYGRVKPHGQEFRTLMHATGLSAAATHKLPVAHLQRRKYLYLHRCGDCGYTFIARSIRRRYYCVACGPEMSWRIVRAPNTPQGRKTLNDLKKQLAATAEPA